MTVEYIDDVFAKIVELPGITAREIIHQLGLEHPRQIKKALEELWCDARVDRVWNERVAGPACFSYYAAVIDAQ